MPYTIFLATDKRTKTWGKNQPIPKRLLRKIAEQRKQAEAATRALFQTTEHDVNSCPTCQGLVRELFHL